MAFLDCINWYIGRSCKPNSAPLVAFNFKCAGYLWPEARVRKGNIKFFCRKEVIHLKTTSASVRWMFTDAWVIRQKQQLLWTHHPEPALMGSPCSWTHRWNRSRMFSTDWTRRWPWWWPSRPQRTPSSSLSEVWTTPRSTLRWSG